MLVMLSSLETGRLMTTHYGAGEAAYTPACRMLAMPPLWFRLLLSARMALACWRRGMRLHRR